MRTLARAKADRMSKPASSASLAQTLDQISEEEREEILKYVEQEQTQVKLQKSKNTDWYQLSFYIIKVLSFQGEALDEVGIKKIILNFEKKILKNREMRIKFPDSPEKFMESEMEVHEILQEMRVLATAPDYYPLLVKLGVISSLLELLSHDNTDIAVSNLLAQLKF